jgi:hypothetical protein
MVLSNLPVECAVNFEFKESKNKHPIRLVLAGVSKVYVIERASRYCHCVYGKELKNNILGNFFSC